MTACSLATSLEGFSNGEVAVDAAGEAAAAPVDAARDTADARDASSDTSTPLDAGDDAGGPNLHPRGTFEDGTCDGWTSYQGSLSPSTVAHTGTASCMACTAPSTADFFTADDIGSPGPAVVGATYRAEGWVRTAPGKADPGLATIILRNYALDPTFRSLESSGSPDGALDTQWRRFEATMKITQPGGTLNVFIGAQHRPGACFLLDDIVVRRID